MSATRAMVPDATMTIGARFLNTFGAGPVMAEAIISLYRSGADVRPPCARSLLGQTVLRQSRSSPNRRQSTQMSLQKPHFDGAGLRWQGMPLQLRANPLPPADCANYSGKVPPNRMEAL